MSTDHVPSDLHYTKDHEWVRREGDAVVLGITAHAVDQLGDITMISPKAVGTRVAAGDAACDIDSVKVAAQLYSPVSGTISAANGELDAAPELVNQDPYGRGWMVKIDLADAGELAGLMDADAYREFLATT